MTYTASSDDTNQPTNNGTIEFLPVGELLKKVKRRFAGYKSSS